MVTLETLKSSPPGTVNLYQQNEEEHLPGQVEDDFSAMSLKLKSQQTGSDMHLQGHVEVNLSEVSNALPINDQEEVAVSNDNNSGDSSLEAGETEQQKFYRNCMKLFYICGFLLGIRLKYDWKPLRCFMFYFCILSLAFVAYSIGITAYHYCLNGEYVKTIEPFSVSGVVVSCTLKLIGYVKNRQNILSLFFMMRKFLRPNISGRQAETVLLNLRKTWKFLLIITLGCWLSYSLFALIPIILYITKNELSQLLPVEVIFCDMTQISGYIIGTFIQGTMGAYSAVGTIFHASVIIFCITTYIMQGDLIEKDFEDLNAMWDGKNKISVQYKHAFLKNICKKRQDMNDFLFLLKAVYEPTLIKYFYYSYFAQIIILFDITQNDWLGGVGPACGLLVEMMFYCYMGTQLSIVNDKLCYIIYDSNWHRYDLESQRMIQLLLHDAQQPKELQVGLIGPLNLVTGVMIVKSIYSYYTVMKEVF